MGTSDGPLSGDAMASAQGGPPVRAYPYLIKAGETLIIKSVSLELHGTITNPKIRGTNVDGFDVPEAALKHQGGDLYEATNLTVAIAFPSGATAFYDTFDIDWEVALDGTTWQPAGTSSNKMYVCLVDPLALIDKKLFRTAVHLACSTPGATSATALDMTWAQFSDGSGPTNVTTWDGKPLFYYQPGFSAYQNTDNDLVSPSQLLTMGRGQCGAWTELLRLALAINDVGSNHIKATCTGASAVGFWVNDWHLVSTSRPFWFQGPPTPSPHPERQADMIPFPPGGAYSFYDDPTNQINFENQRDVKGQGTAGTTDCPSEKVFGSHQFVQVGGTYYDPSYGVTYTSEADFQTHLAGWGTLNTVGTYLKLNVLNFTGTMIDFEVVVS